MSLKRASFFTSIGEMGSRMTANNPGAADPGRRHPVSHPSTIQPSAPSVVPVPPLPPAPHA
jgi:hypothetical protein